MKERRKEIRCVPYTAFVKYPLGNYVVQDLSPSGCQVTTKSLEGAKIGGPLNLKFGSGTILIKGTIKWISWNTKPVRIGICFDESDYNTSKLLYEFAKEHAIKHVLRRIRESGISR